MAKTVQAWRAKVSGASLEIVTGTTTGAQGQEVVLTRAVVPRVGQVIREPLVAHFVKRWEDGEAHARSLVDRVEVDVESGQVVASGDDAAAKASAEDQSGDVVERLREAQTAREEAVAENDWLVARVAEVEQQLAADAEEAEHAVADLRSQLAVAEENLADAVSYEDLSAEALAVEVAKRDLQVTRADGKDGDPLKSDNVRALREDDGAS